MSKQVQVRLAKAFIVLTLALGMIAFSGFPAEAHWPTCGYNEVYRATYYYEYPGGPECGLTYMYCWGDVTSYHEGCQTAYYDQWYNSCQCN